jgi:hypothetical protein
MSMKQKIMEKLFAEKPLTNEEILHIGSRLGEDAPEKIVEGKTSVLPFDHTVKDSLSKACSLREEDFDRINKLIRTEVMDRKDELDCDSKQIEVYEKIGMAKPQNFRLLMYQFVKMRSQLQKKESGSGFGLRMGSGKDFGDFLDFLRRGGQ